MEHNLTTKVASSEDVCTVVEETPFTGCILSSPSAPYVLKSI
jgi:hypothetical protein